MKDLITLKQSLSLTDKQVLGDWLMPEDVDRAHIAKNENYVWYYAIGQYFKPKTIAEIGVKYGYSIKSLLEGAGSIYVEGYDNEIHRPGSNQIVIDRLIALGVKHRIYNLDTQQINILTGDFDLVHVDGSHVYNDALHDMRLAWAAIKYGGIMLVDDCRYIDFVQRALQDFCKEQMVASVYLPSYRGLSMVIK